MDHGLSYVDVSGLPTIYYAKILLASPGSLFQVR